MRNQLLLLCLLQAFTVYNQVIHPVITTTQFPGAWSLHFADIFSVESNPAALANIDMLKAGIRSERKFMLHELSTYAGAIAIPAKSGSLGIALERSGSGDFNESQVGVAYAKKLGNIDLGIRFNYDMISVKGYGNDDAVSLEAGTIWHITDKLHTGIHIVNPQGGRFNKNRQEKLASLFSIGIGYEVSEQLLIQMEIIKEESKLVNICTALEYNPVSKFFAVMGINTVPGSTFFGAGWELQHFRTDILMSYHWLLGITPGIRLIFYSKK